MEQARLIRTAFLLAAASAFVVLPPALPRGTVMSSLLDDLSPDGSRTTASPGMWHFLRTLVTSKESSERCAGTSLTTLPAAAADARANDRDWCHVNDFWAVNVGELYALTSAAVVDREEAAIKLIELSVASADEPEK